MIKKFTLLLLAMLCIAGIANAKTSIITLWEGTSEADAEINISKDKFSEAASGDMIQITFSFTTAGSLHLCYKTGKGGDWSAKAFNGISEWPYYSDTSITSDDFSINSTDLTTLKEYGMYIYGFTSSTITKVELIHTLTPSSTTNISKDSYTADWTGKQYAAVSEAKIGDVIQFTYTATGDWFQFHVMNYAKGEDFATAAYSVTTDETYTYEYVIPDLTTLKKICEEGFSIKGADFEISSVDLLTYSDSYGYVTITIGDTGYATWSSDKKYDFASAGITAYYASNVTTGVVTLTPMDITWDWQGYILKADPKTYDVLESLTTDGTYYPSTNYLKQNISESSIAASVEGTIHYIFAKDNTTGEIGFYKLVDDAHTLAAHKAYLETTKDFTPPTPPALSMGSRSYIRLSFGGGGGTTAINTALKNPIVEDGIYYTLQGVAVKNPSKGIYILNGKKVFVK